jgi:hypothetical protein
MEPNDTFDVDVEAGEPSMPGELRQFTVRLKTHSEAVQPANGEEFSAADFPPWWPFED